MNMCETCKHWKFFRYDYGSCSKIEEKIEIQLVTGWDGGYVKEIETEKDFGCTLWEEKDEN